LLEYAWDISAANAVKCDPCPTQPLNYSELREAGVFWVNHNTRTPNQYFGNAFVTRLHVRYNREDYPQDLVFQQTPNKENFQGRYVVRHPAKGDFSCEAGQQYLKDLRERRVKEVEQLAELTNRDVAGYNDYINEYAHLIVPQNDWIDGEFDNTIKNGLDLWLGMQPNAPWWKKLLAYLFLVSVVSPLLYLGYSIVTFKRPNP